MDLYTGCDPAFPSNDGICNAGMTIRQYAAIHILAGMIAARPQTRDPFESVHQMRFRLARAAWAAADALLDPPGKQPEAPSPHSIREDDGEPE